MQQTVSRAFSGEFKKWRSVIAQIATILILGLMLFWAWQYRFLIVNLFVEMGVFRIIIMCVLMTLDYLLSALVFTLLVREMGYSFGFLNGYNDLNLAQIAAMLPGKIWGYLGLAGLLWSAGISKQDSVLIVILNLALMLSGCLLVGAIGLIPFIGWLVAAVLVTAILILIFGRGVLESFRARFFPGTSKLPSTRALVGLLGLAIITWLILAGCFAWLVSINSDAWTVSPLTVAVAYPAGYLAGFVSLIAPSGLGVSEGISALVLGPVVGLEKAFALAVAFRAIYTLVQWLNIAFTLIFLSLARRKKAFSP